METVNPSSKAHSSQFVQNIFLKQIVLVKKAFKGVTALGGWLRNPDNTSSTIAIYIEGFILTILCTLMIQSRSHTSLLGGVANTLGLGALSDIGASASSSLDFIAALGSGIMVLIEAGLFIGVLILCYRIAYQDSMPLYVAAATIALPTLVFAILHLVNTLLFLIAGNQLYFVLQLAAGAIKVVFLFLAIQAAGQKNTAYTVSIVLAIIIVAGAMDAIINLNQIITSAFGFLIG